MYDSIYSPWEHDQYITTMLSMAIIYANYLVRPKNVKKDELMLMKIHNTVTCVVKHCSVCITMYIQMYLCVRMLLNVPAMVCLP